MTRRAWVGLALLLGALFAFTTPVQAQTSGPFILSSVTCTPGYPVANKGSIGVQINGTGTWTAEFQGSIDGVRYDAITATDRSDTTPALLTEVTAQGSWTGNVGGLNSFRVCLTAYTSGQPAIWMGNSDSGGAGGGGAGGAVPSAVSVTDLEDGGGDSVGDVANDSIRVTIAADAVGIGGGIQYTEADIDATIVGTAMMMEGAGNTLVAAQGTAANGLEVDVTRVTGTVTVGATDLDVQSGGADILSTTAFNTTHNDAFGTAGSSDSQVRSIQGIASGVAVTVSATNLDVQSGGLDLLPGLAQNAATSGQPGALIFGAVTTAAPSYTNAQSSALSLTEAGLLRVAVEAGGGTGGTSQADGATYTAGSTAGTPIMGFYEASPSTCTTGDTCAAGLTTNRELKVSVTSGVASGLTDGAAFVANTTVGQGLFGVYESAPTTLTDNDYGMAGLTATRAVRTQNEIAGAAISGSNPSYTYIVSNGSTTPITIPESQTQNYHTAAGTDTIELFGMAIPSASGAVGVDSNNPFPVITTSASVITAVGNAAHDSPATGNPLTMGVTALAYGADPTAVTAGDVTRAHANRDGVLFVLGGHPNIQTYEFQVQDADGAQTDLAMATCGTGCKVVVTEADVTCDPDTSDDTSMRMGFGTANVPSGAHTGTAGVVLAWDGIPQGGGRIRGDGSGIIGVGADGEDLRLTIADPVGGSCNVLVSYFTIES